MNDIVSNATKLSEYIRDHLISQLMVSEDEEEGCRYRGEAGMSCAVGCVIEDRYYNCGYEGIQVMPGWVMPPEYDQGHQANVMLQRLKKSIVDSLGRELTELDTKILIRWQAYHDNFYGTWLADNNYHSPNFVHTEIVMDVIAEFERNY